MDSAPDPISAPDAILPHLPAFLSVAQTGSIARSSGEMRKASSAIARSIGELEAALGAALFERKPRGMLINSYGEAVLMRARRISDQAEQIADELCRIRAQGAISRSVVHSLMFGGRKLRLLEQVSELRQVSAAAERLGLSQAGASMALGRIEDAVGRPLFHRMAQGMVATDAADRLIAAGKRVFAELRHMQAELSALAGTQQGTIIVGALPLGRTHIVPTAVARALRRFPRAQVRMVEAPYDDLAARLRTGDVDFIFGALRPPDQCRGLLTEPLFDDRIGILARAGHPLAGAPALRAADLPGMSWILPRRDTPGRRQIDASFAALGLRPPQASVETGDLAIVRQLLCASDMLVAMSPRQLQVEIDSGLVAELPVLLPQTSRTIGLTLREGALLPPLVLAVLEEVRRLAGEVGTAT